MKITVTQEHIDKGKRGHYKSCPVALAINSAGFRDTSVGITTFDTSKGRWLWKKNYNGHFSTRVYEFIRDFDMNDSVGPFTFEIEMTKC